MCHPLLWFLPLPASKGTLQGFLSTPYSSSTSLTIYSDMPDTGKLLENERGVLIKVLIVNLESLSEARVMADKSWVLGNWWN